MNLSVNPLSTVHRKRLTLEWLLFLVLIVYLALRAVFVPPLHDEVATFFHFIETGDIWSDTAMLDANNHLLNSYLSRFSYLIFGEEFWALRLPNVLVYAVYFWSTVLILKQLKGSFIYWVTLLSLNTIPFVIEYYAMTRGYGMGIAFLLASILLIIKWRQEEKMVMLILGLTMAWLSVFANLIFINSFVLLVFYVLLTLLVRNSQSSIKKTLISIFLAVSSCIALWPLIAFGLRMKKAGALYYGSLDGLWEVTGRSLSNYTLFTEHVLIKWLLILIILGIAIWSFRHLLINKLLKSIHSTPLFMSFLFLGNLVITLILALVFEVNYPEDRAGIHFVFLFILSFAFVLEELNVAPVSVIFLFFPLTFILKLNLSETVVTPDQTLSTPFYEQIKRKTNKNSTIQVYPTQALVWAYYQRKEPNKKLAKVDRDMNETYDYIVTREPFYEPSKHTGFMVLGYDELTKDYILENKRQRKEVLKETIPFGKFEIHDEFEEVLRRNYPQRGILKINLSGRVSPKRGRNMLTLVIHGRNEQGESVYYKYYDLRWYYGIENDQYQFELNHSVDLNEENISELVVYFWNRQKNTYSLNNTQLELWSIPTVRN